MTGYDKNIFGNNNFKLKKENCFIETYMEYISEIFQIMVEDIFYHGLISFWTLLYIYRKYNELLLVGPFNIDTLALRLFCILLIINQRPLVKF